NFSLIIELIVAGLLLVTIVYCFVLDRRLAALRNGQDGLRDVIASLNSATQQAQTSVMQLKATGEQTSADLKGAITDARALADELSVMVEAGDGIADRLAGARSGPADKADTDKEAGVDVDELRAAVGRLSEAAKRVGDTQEEEAKDIARTLGGVR
ncbi:MAG: DUF6468 domain-containing protein, partial [Pseudomonadota bacterium]